MNDKRVSEMAVQKLSVVWEKRYLCPRCQQKLRYVPGDAVAIVDGRVDMTRTQPYYVCDKCHTSYRELMGSGYFEEYEGVDARLPSADAPAGAGQAAAPERRPAKPKHPLRSTGELEPVQLKREYGERHGSFSLFVLRLGLPPHRDDGLFPVVGAVRRRAIRCAALSAAGAEKTCRNADFLV